MNILWPNLMSTKRVGRLWNEEKALTLIEDVLTYSLLKRSKIRE